MAGENEAKSSNDLSAIKITSCFLHFEGTKDCCSEITKQTVEKFLSYRKRWAGLQGKEGDVARKSYELFDDEVLKGYINNHPEFEFRWPYHKACYKKLCDGEKIKRAEEKKAKTVSSQNIDDAASVVDSAPPQGSAVQNVEYVPDTKMTRLSLVQENGRGFERRSR